MTVNMSAIFYILILVASVSISTCSTYRVISRPGDVLTTEYAIMGGGATVWQGIAFQCDSNNHGFISLRHSLFVVSNKPEGYCNNGAIVARALGVVNGTYVSQINVTVSPELNNTTMECVHSYNLTEVVVRSI